MDTTHHVNAREIKIAISQYVRLEQDVPDTKVVTVTFAVDNDDRTSETIIRADVSVVDRK